MVSKLDFASSITELSDELEYLGFAPLPKYNYEDETSTSNADTFITLISSITHAFWNFIQHYHVTVRSYEEKEEKYSQHNDEKRCLQVEVQHLKEKLSRKEKNVIHVNHEDEKLRTQCSVLSVELKKEKNEALHLQNKLRHQQSEMTHLLKKKDGEINQLQERLRHAINLKVPKLPNTKNLTPAEKETVYRRIICKMEMNSQILIQDNLTLREILFKQHLHLHSLTLKFKEVFERHCEDSKPDMLFVPEAPSKEQYKLPCELLSRKIKSATEVYLKTLGTIATMLDGIL